MNSSEADLEMSQLRVKQLEEDVRLLRAELEIAREDYRRMADAIAKHRKRAKIEVTASPHYALAWKGIVRELGEIMTEALPDRPHGERLREKVRK